MSKNSKKIVVPPCFTCKNYNGNYTCRAFPEGIPEDIKNGAPHDKVRDDQTNDIVHELNTPSER